MEGQLTVDGDDIVFGDGEDEMHFWVDNACK